MFSKISQNTLVRLLKPSKEKDIQRQAIDHVPSVPSDSGSLQPKESELIVVLDLDETLICNITSRDIPFPPYTSIGNFWLCYDHDKDRRHRILMRPGLIEFLQKTMSRYETHIFTAACSVVADPILDNLEKLSGHSFGGRWYRNHCTKRGSHFVKDLSAVPRLANLNKTVLVDNNPLSFMANPQNAIPIRDFRDEPDDNSLRTLSKVLRGLEKAGNVRSVLGPHFQMQRILDDLNKTGDFLYFSSCVFRVQL